jgi:phage repressor protein C with HTH and peptisase S24 domain
VLFRSKTVSEETRQKMRDNAKNREREHYNKGSETRRKNPRIVSEETRLKISQALSRKKRLFTEEHKRNISVAKLGKKGQHIVSEETRLKISQALSGKKRLFTDEAKRNIAIAASNNFKGKTWKIVDGKRVWVER